MADDALFETALAEAYRANAAGRYAASLVSARTALARARALESIGLELRATRIEASSLSLMDHQAEAFDRLESVRAIMDTEAGKETLKESRVAQAVVASFLDWVEVTGWMSTPITTADRLAMLDETDALLDSIGKPQWRSGVLSLRATIMKSLRKLDDAARLGEEAIRCFVLAAPGSTLASYRQQHADVLLDMGPDKLESAEVQYMQILTEPARSLRNEKSAYVGLARCALKRGDARSAKERAEKAIAIAEPLGDSAMLGALDVLTLALRATGELDHASAVVDQMIERARRTGSGQRLFYAVRSQIDLSFEREDDDGLPDWIDELASIAASLDKGTGTEHYMQQVLSRRARLAKRTAH